MNWTILEILAICALIIAAARWFIAALNLFFGQPRQGYVKAVPGEISVLIPARNEAENLPHLLQSLQNCNNIIGEILVYNDQSQDETSAVTEHWAGYDPRITIIEGVKLPHGWLGKNHACHQLALSAKGKYLLFLDADVKINQRAIDLAIYQMKQKKLALFSFFPSQKMHSPGEWLLVAHVNVILTSLLPLPLTAYIPLSILAAANGQFMMFNAESYHNHKFHEKLRTAAVEDVAIAQYIKKMGLRMRTALAPKGLTCRMYHGYSEALEGLARSARFFFGGSIVAGWIYVFFSLAGWIPIAITMHPIWLAIYFLLLLTMRIFVATASHQSVLKNIALMPFQQIALFHLFVTATKQIITGKTKWKGRDI